MKPCKNQGGEIVVWSRGSRLVSGNYHEDLGPVASFWRQQTWKSAMFLATLFHAEHFLQVYYSSVV
jgi:hypothetical protein